MERPGVNALLLAEEVVPLNWDQADVIQYFSKYGVVNNFLQGKASDQKQIYCVKYNSETAARTAVQAITQSTANLRTSIFLSDTGMNEEKISTGCDVCGSKGDLICSTCKTWYCSEECQHMAWPRHMQFCKPPPPLTRPLNTKLLLSTSGQLPSPSVFPPLLAAPPPLKITSKGPTPLPSPLCLATAATQLEAAAPRQPLQPLQTQTLSLLTPSTPESFSFATENRSAQMSKLTDADNKENIPPPDEKLTAPQSILRMSKEAQAQLAVEQQAAEAVSAGNTMETAIFLHYESAVEIYLMPSGKVAAYENMMGKLMDPQEPLKYPRVGFICIAVLDDVCYRAKVLSVEKGETATLAFMDAGFIKTLPIKGSLFVLKGRFKDLEPFAQSFKLDLQGDAQLSHSAEQNLKQLLKKDATVQYTARGSWIKLFDPATGEDLLSKALSMPLPAEPITTEVIKEVASSPKPSHPVQHDANNKVGKQVTLKTPMQQRLSKVHRILNNQHPELAKKTEVSSIADKKTDVASADKKNVHFVDVKSSGDCDVGPEKEKGEVAKKEALTAQVSESPAEAAKVDHVTKPVVTADLKTHADGTAAVIPEAFRGEIINVDSATEFYVHRTSNTQLYEQITECIQDCTSSLPSEDLTVGLICGYKADDDVIYRARVVQVHRDRVKVKIFMLDEGRKSKTEIGRLRKLTTFNDVPGLVLKCGLELEPSCSEQELEVVKKNLLEKKEVEIDIVPKYQKDDTFTVELYSEGTNLRGQLFSDEAKAGYTTERKVELQKPGEVQGTPPPTAVESVAVEEAAAVKTVAAAKTIDSEPEKLAKLAETKPSVAAAAAPTPVSDISVDSEPNKKIAAVAESKPAAVNKPIPVPFECLVTYIKNLDEFYVVNSKTYNDIIMDIQDGVGAEMEEVRQGDICAFMIDSLWARVRVDSVSGDTVTMTTIDEGRQVETSTKNLHELTVHKTTPGCAIKCGLTDLDVGTDEASIEGAMEIFTIFADIDGLVELKAVPIAYKGDTLLVDLYENAVDGFSLKEIFQESA